MKQWIKTYIPYIVIGICLFWIASLSLETRNPSLITIYKTDTITLTKIDTLELVSPIFKYKRVVDTFYVYAKDSYAIALPIEQKRYTEPDKYDLYISGVNPSLDTIRVFNKTIERTVTNNITNTVYKNAWKGYIGGQIQSFGNEVIPTIKFDIITPKNVLFGAGIGLYDNRPIYQFNVSYKIFEK